MDDPLPGRYEYHDDADPAAATYLANPDAVASDAGGRVNAVLYVYDEAGCTIGTVTVWEDDLPADIGTVYRVTTTDDGEVIDLEWGSTVAEAFSTARETGHTDRDRDG
jgi:hypothetical protein